MNRPSIRLLVVGLVLWGAQLDAEDGTRSTQCSPSKGTEATCNLHARAARLAEHATLRSMLQENNQLRVSKGLNPLRISARLSAAAQNHANYMARTRRFSHYCNGCPTSRACLYGYRSGVRENIAFGQPSARSVFAIWAASVKHNENLLSQSDLAGFGFARAENGQVYWVAMYGPADNVE